MENFYKKGFNHVDYVAARAKAVRKAGISVGLANLGVSKVCTEDPNRCYGFVNKQNYGTIYTDGETEYKLDENGYRVFAVTNASWAAVPNVMDSYVTLHTQLDKTRAASAIQAWRRKEKAEAGFRIKRLGYPLFTPQWYEGMLMSHLSDCAAEARKALGLRPLASRWGAATAQSDKPLIP